MQTLIDPFELAFPPPPRSERPSPTRSAPTPAPGAPLEAQVDRESDQPPPLPRSPDSSGRLRCWCSEE